jgi:hypothetical protein
VSACTFEPDFYQRYFKFAFQNYLRTPSVLKYKAFKGSKFIPKYKAS